MPPPPLDRHDPDALAAAWAACRADNDRIRIRDAAGRLGVTEAELLATTVGDGVTRIAPDWQQFLESAPELGTVMVLTRNDHAVHEKTGIFDRIVWDDERPVVLDRAINLRIRIDAWRHAFAVVEQLNAGPRFSFHIFDSHGTAVLKIYLRAPGGDPAAFARFVDRFRTTDQSRRIAVTPPPARQPPAPDSAIDAAALEAEWRRMEDTHELFTLAERHGAGRVQAYRLMPDDLARPVDNGAFTRMLEAAAADGEGLMIFVGSPGTVQIHIGQVHTIKRSGPFQNVLDPGFDLHLLEGGIATSWIVRKPTKDGWIESLEIFDADGGQIAWVFGERRPGSPQKPSWAALLRRIAPMSGEA